MLTFTQGLSKEEVLRLVVPIFVLSEGANFVLKIYLADQSNAWVLVSESTALAVFTASICLSAHYIISLIEGIEAKN